MKTKFLQRVLWLMIPLLTIFSTDVSGQVWKKVTSAPDSWAGEYLLVYESSSTAGKAWTGVDAASCGADVTISSGVISTKPDGAVSITVAAYSGGYSIKINGGTNNGKYIGRSVNSNGIDIGASQVKNTFSYESSSVKIVGTGGAVLRYNSGSGQERFRYFKSSTYTSQQIVQLYKKSYTVTYNANGGSGTMTDSNSPYDAGATVTTKTNTFTNSGYTFDHWDTKADDSGTDYAEGATFTISANTTLYAQWASAGPTPTITVSKTSIAFGDQKMGTNYQETFTVSGSDLSADINLSVGGANPTLFSIDKTSLTQSGGTVSTTTITVTWTPSASYNAATITISSTGATSKTVTLSGTGKWEVVWKNDGVTHATTLVASGTKPTFPSTPTSCDATSTDFVGWTNAEWSGKIDNVAGKTIHTNNTTMDNVSANGTIYYAVFAEADFEEGPAVGTTIYAEDFSAWASSDGADPSGTYTNSHTGTTLYSGSVTYSKTNGSGTTQIKTDGPYAGGTKPELMVAKGSGTFVITGIPRCGASELTLSYKQNAKSITSSVSGTGYSGGKGTSTSGTTTTDIICGSGSTFTLTFTGPSGSDNVRLDDISITVKTKAGSYVQYLTNCCTSYDITLSGSGSISGAGTFSADATSACEGATVTLSTNICSGYTVGAWDVYKTGTPATKITVTSNQFTMPAYGVTVALSTTAKVDHFKDAMHETSGYTGDGYTVSGCNQTVPNLSNTTPASECEGEHYKFVGWVDDAHVDSDGTLLSGYSIVSGGTTSWNATGTTYYAVWAKEL